MPPITVSTEVHRPAAVYAYATDPSRFAEWQKGVVSGRLETSGQTGAAVRCITVRRIGLMERANTSAVVRADPPQAWAVRGIDGPIRAAVDVTVDPIGADKCRLTIAVDFEGHGIGHVLVPLVVRRQARAEMPANVAALKARLEADG